MKPLIVLLLASATFSGQTVSQLKPQNVTASEVSYQGRKAVRLLAAPLAENGISVAVLVGTRFHNGTLEVDVAGKPGPGAVADARGFIGMAFRIQGGRHEYIYLRPTNGRADDQVRRNHSVQYSSHPDFDFARFRREAPEKYEAYVDLEPGVWTKYKVIVQGPTAKLYVHGADQPCLIVNDLKLGDTEGGVGLWVGPGTEGYFSNLKITPAAR